MKIERHEGVIEILEDLRETEPLRDNPKADHDVHSAIRHLCGETLK